MLLLTPSLTLRVGVESISTLDRPQLLQKHLNSSLIRQPENCLSLEA